MFLQIFEVLANLSLRTTFHLVQILAGEIRNGSKPGERMEFELFSRFAVHSRNQIDLEYNKIEMRIYQEDIEKIVEKVIEEATREARGRPRERS